MTTSSLPFSFREINLSLSARMNLESTANKLLYILKLLAEFPLTSMACLNPVLFPRKQRSWSPLYASLFFSLTLCKPGQKDSFVSFLINNRTLWTLHCFLHLIAPMPSLTHPPTHSPKRYWFSTFCRPGIALGAEDTVVNEPGMSLLSQCLHFSLEDNKNKF